MNWQQIVTNPELLASPFGSEPPRLAVVELEELAFSTNLDQISLKCFLLEFPKAPPADWVKVGYNRIVLCLVLSGIVDLRLDEIAANNQYAMIFGVSDHLKSLQMTRDRSTLLITAEKISLTGASPYIHEDGPL